MSAPTATLRLGIAGLGRVGATAPAVPAPDNRAQIIRNHLQAALSAGGIDIAALIEPDSAHVEALRAADPRIAGAKHYTGLSDVPAGSLDVIVLCTATARREEDIAAALTLHPRLLLVEKPLAGDSGVAQSLLKAAEEAGVDLKVNFNRRYDASTQRHFQAAITEPPRAAVCRYSNGLLNYASHMVDLLSFWFGDIESVQAIGPKMQAAPDPTVSFRCDMAAGFPAYVLGLPDVDYDQFEIELFLPQRQVQFVANGVEKRVWEAAADLYYPGYAHLRERPDARDDTPTGGFVEYYRALVAAVNSGAPLPGCTGSEALANLQVLEAVHASLDAGGRIVTL